jgi:hypothetical protein
MKNPTVVSVLNGVSASVSVAQPFASNQSNTVTPAGAAEYLGVAENTLSIWRCTNRYPLKYIKVGRRVRYRISDLEAFLTARTVS